MVFGALPGDIVVTNMDLRLGDVCVGTVRDGVLFYFSSHHEVIVEADEVTVRVKVTSSAFGYLVHQRRVNTCPQLIIRSRGVQRDPNFPSTCTRCGREAYVSALAVEHRDEIAAKDCPARRA